MDLFRGAAAFIAWLSGSLAAIAGLLYAFGYLATLSNLHSLGLNPLILSFDPLFYLQRGSSFALYVIRLLFNVLLIPMIVFVAITLFVLAIGHFWHKHKAGKGTYVKFEPFKEKIKKISFLLYAVILSILFFEMSTSYVELTRVLNISDLLYQTDTQNTVDGPASALRQALTSDRHSDAAAALLDTTFLDSILFLLEVAILFAAAWRLTVGRQFRPLLVTPFALALATFFVSLPMIYGVVVLPNEFSTVRILADHASIRADAEYFLLNKTAQEFIVWDSENEQALWVPLNSVSKVEVGRIEALPFSNAHTEREQKP